MTEDKQSFVRDDHATPINVNDLILALEKFRAEHGDAARVSLFFHDGNEIHPYQIGNVDDAFYDYNRGDVCNIELVQ